MIAPLFAESTMGEVIMRGLAVVGGAALGAALAGWALGWVQRNFFEQQTLPRFAYWIVMGASAILFGLLTYYLVFGTGGWGIGGPGGGGTGGGTKEGVKEGKKDTPADPTKEGKKPKKDERPSGTTVLRVQVLGNAALCKLLDVPNPAELTEEQRDHRYRFEGGRKRELLDLKGVQKRIREERKGGKLERVDVLTYDDGPVPNQPEVVGLEEWVKGLQQPGVKCVVEKTGEKSPVD
jgi:hypothetical protein